MASQPDDDLLFQPLLYALRALRGRSVRVDILTPPYPCAGVGELRVVRLEPQGGTSVAGPTTIVATYQNFERLGGRPP